MRPLSKPVRLKCKRCGLQFSDRRHKVLVFGDGWYHKTCLSAVPRDEHGDQVQHRLGDEKPHAETEPE